MVKQIANQGKAYSKDSVPFTHFEGYENHKMEDKRGKGGVTEADINYVGTYRMLYLN